MRKQVVLVLILGGRLLWGWGSEGHRLVARIAQARLTPAARAQVAQVLLPDESIASRASWADEVRPFRKETEPWHFIDIPIDSAGLNMKRDCPPQGCIIAKIAEFRTSWRNPAASPTARREALLFLVHFVGDLHQPLHCADHHDKGGNDVHVLFLGEPMNLHRLWDQELLKRMPEEEQLYAALLKMITPERARAWSGGTVENWAEESFRIAQRTVYGLLPPVSRAEDPVPLGQGYQRAAEPIIEQRIAQAGVRLAAILNESAR